MSYMKRVTPANLRGLDPRQWMRHAGRSAGLLTAVTIDDTDQPKKPAEHRLEIERSHYTSTGARYRVTYLGETLLASARDPEFEACRALLAQGITGTLVSYGPGSLVPRMRVDIEKGAKLATIDSDKDGPRIGRYRLHPSSAGEDEAD
jgi:hypothetical protein